MIFQSFRNLFKIPELRTKILYTALFLIIYRLGSHIPIPGLDITKISGSENGVLGLLSTLSGGALSRGAIFSLGIMPYISASIIFSLLTKVIPSLEALSKEGASGHKKINEYTRYAVVPLCLIQSIMVVKYFTSNEGLVTDTSPFFYVVVMVALTSGSIFLMWLGEQITEYGIGNGISLIIMAGIVSRMPHLVEQIIGAGAEDGGEIRKFLVLLVLFVVIVGAVVYITYGQRKITVQQAKHTRGRRVYGGQKHSLPLKVNQAGVMPVIFASSLLIFPMSIVRWISKTPPSQIDVWFGPGTFSYIMTYIILIYFFSYFWTSLMFQPSEMANQLKEYGSFIPGIRPGQKTASYLEKVMVHITFIGAAFLATIALMPQIVSLGLDLRGPQSSFVYSLGGTSILIVVGVILDIVQKLESHLLMRHYDGFSKKGKIRGRRS